MLISSIYKSLQRHVVEIMEDIKLQTGVVDIEYWSWESRADENELPKKALIGLSGVDFNENRGLWVIRAAVGLSPWEDKNLDETVRMLDVIYDHLGTGSKVNLLEPNSGALISELVVTDFQMAPASTSELRNYRVVNFELLRTDTATV